MQIFSGVFVYDSKDYLISFEEFALVLVYRAF